MEPHTGTQHIDVIAYHNAMQERLQPQGEEWAERTKPIRSSVLSNRLYFQGQDSAVCGWTLRADL